MKGGFVCHVIDEQKSDRKLFILIKIFEFFDKESVSSVYFYVFFPMFPMLLPLFFVYHRHVLLTH